MIDLYVNGIAINFQGLIGETNVNGQSEVCFKIFFFFLKNFFSFCLYFYFEINIIIEFVIFIYFFIVCVCFFKKGLYFNNIVRFQNDSLLQNGTNLIALSVRNTGSSSDTYVAFEAGIDISIVPFFSRWFIKLNNFVRIETTKDCE